MRGSGRYFGVLGGLVVLLAAVAGQAAGREAREAAAPPNVVLIFADDLGHGDTGPFGAQQVRTPALDRLAREGRKLTSFYVPQAVCSASRAALLTGCYPNRIGILGALAPQHRHGISDFELTMAEMLRARGYATAVFGKWHLGHHPRFLPPRHGFDEYYGIPYSNDMWPRHPSSRFPDLPLIEGEKTVALNPDQSRFTTEFGERAVRFIEKNRQRPFFVYVPHPMPHVPLFVSEKHKGRSAAGLFGDVIEEIDDSVGRILEALDRNNLTRNTLVIFTSDNGPWLTYGNHAGSSGGLREGKGTSFEGGVRVPFLARWPGRIPSGSVSDQPAMTIDLLPTVARITGASLPPHRIDGKDAWPLLTSGRRIRGDREGLAYYWGGHLDAVRMGPWKLHFQHPYQSLAQAGADGKPGRYQQRQMTPALYHLEKDRAESRDVAAEHPEVVARLTAWADEVRKDLGDTGTGVKGAGVREPGRL